MPQQIPDFETLVLTRLAVCNKEIQSSGLKTVYTLPPATAPNMRDFPLAITIPSAMRAPIPGGSAGLVIVTRDYIIMLPVAPWTETMDTTSQGSDANTVASKWFAIIRNYYINHPHLQTDANNGTDPLQYIFGDLEFQDNGLSQLTAPGGSSGSYVGIRYILTISMRARATRVS